MPHTIALAQCGSLPDTTKNLKTAEYFIHQAANARSEERRVGKECSEPCRSRWSPYH